MKYFFTYSDDLPDNCGFELYGIVHMIWLLIIIIAVFAFVMSKRYIKEKLLCFQGNFLLFLIIIRLIVVTLIGHMSVYELPFHLCSIAGILCFIHSRYKIWWLGQIIYTLCLPGTVAALIFPNWTEYPAMNFITIQAFLFHGGIVLYIAVSLNTKNIVPDFKGIIYSAVFLVFITVPIYLFDRCFNVNYLFVLRPSAGSPLEWMENCMGNPGYLIGYALLVVLVMFIMNFFYYIYKTGYKGYRGR